jgi:Alpha/beta hydrolase domain
MPWWRTVALAAPVLAALVAAPAADALTLEPSGRQALAAGYERVFGTARGTVAGDEPVRGLPAGGASYAVEYELIRPTSGARPRMLLVEAENRGSPPVRGPLTGPEPGASGPPSTAVYPAAASRFLKAHRLAYARVQWQTGLAAGVPATAQGVGEVIVRDFAAAVAKRYPRRTLTGVSQGAFFVDTFLAEGFNAQPGGGRAFDHMLTIDGNGNWMAINRLAGAGAQDPYVRPNGRPLSYKRLLSHPDTDPGLVDVANYTDFYRLRAGLTDSGRLPTNARRYDWPSPHQSFSPDAVFGGFGCNGGVRIGLNPLRDDPYLRALVELLARGGTLPASARFTPGATPATSPSFNGLPGLRVPVPKVDRDGQPVGGVRFPELDLPLGRLAPVALSPSVTTSSGAVCGNSGGFAPFPVATVRKRYVSRAAYVRRYGELLARLEAGGLVLGSERGDMLRRTGADYDAATAG